MRERKLYNLKCNKCGKIFRDPDPDAKQCSSCYNVLSAKSASVTHKRKKKHVALTISNLSYLRSKYYAKNMYSISYGNMVSTINAHPDRCVVCDAQLNDSNRASKLGEYICKECDKL